MRPVRLLFITLALLPRTGFPQAGVPLGSEFRVNTYTLSAQKEAAVAFQSSGEFVVVWTSYGRDGEGFGVVGQRYSDTGAPLGSEFVVNTLTTSFEGRPAVDFDSAGNFVVVWTSAQDGISFDISGQRYGSAGLPVGTEFRVNTYTTGSQDYPAVDSDASGSLVVVWTGVHPDFTSDVFGQRYASSGIPLGAEFLVNTYTADSQFSPAVASDPSGNFVVVWTSAHQAALGYDVFGQRFSSAGSPLGPEFLVNTYTTNSQSRPAVAMDASGNYVVVWQSLVQDGSNTGVFGQRYGSTGSPLGPEFRINTYTSFDQSLPALGVDSIGNFVVVWHSVQQDGAFAGIFGQRYDSSGAPLGPEFRVNTYTTDGQFDPTVGSDGAGRFVVVWTSNNQDGSAEGVFGQRYSQIFPVELMGFRVE